MNDALTQTFIFAGGGTGGHLFPATALAEELRRRLPNAEIHFVGTARGIESGVIPKLGYPLHLIAVRGVRRSLSIGNLSAPFVLIVGLVQCVRLLRNLRPAAVIGTGGYVSGPMLFAAALLRFPTVIQEQNSYPGVTTRLLARVVDRVHISFEASRRWFRRKDVMLSGNPVRPFRCESNSARARAVFGLAPDRRTVLVFGGSQGAQALNQALLEGLPSLLERVDAQVLWSTGKNDFEKMSRQTEPFVDRVRVLEFIDDMASAYAAADLVLCRSGALTLAEVTLCGLPSILVPYPFAAADHQATNARALAEVGAVELILQKDLTSNLLVERIAALMQDADRRARMAEAAKRAAFPQAAQKIVDSILELIEEKNR